MRHLISVADLSTETLVQLVQNGINIIEGKWNGFRPLEEKIAGIYFRKPSTRTRSSFTVGAIHLGAVTIPYGPNDLQVVTGESFNDTGRALACYLDFLVIRTNESIQEMRDMAEQVNMAVINAMSATEHPTQVIADLITIKEGASHFGKGSISLLQI